MIEEVVKDYAVYYKLDLESNFQTVQDVIDNMITRLEELTSVVQMIKQKNSDCNSIITEDLGRYRIEIGTLSKKVLTVNDIVIKLQSNIENIEKQVVKAEVEFGINSDSKLKSFLKPFFNRNKEQVLVNTLPSTSQDNLTFTSVMDNFESKKN